MSSNNISKRESCPQCDCRDMTNLVFMEPGKDMLVFVECSACAAFVARYTVKFYTSEDPYRSFLRQMRHRRMASGPSMAKASSNFSEELWSTYRQVKDLVATHEASSDLEDILKEWSGPEE